MLSPIPGKVVVFCSIAQSCPTLRPHGLQASLPFTVSWRLLRLVSVKSVMPSNHLILCHPLLLLPSIFTASGSFPMSQLFTSGSQRIGASASASILPMNIQGWIPVELTDLISLLSKGLLSNEYSPALQFKSFAGKVMSLFFNMLSRFVTAFLPRIKNL